MRARRWAALASLGLVVGLFLLLGPVRLEQARAAGVEEQRLLDLINEYRQENGVASLVVSEALTAAAQRHAKDMLESDSLSHRTEESSYYPDGSTSAERMVREGYPANTATAENIAWGQLTAEEVFEEWRLSPGHDAAMLGEQYNAVGVGRAGSYWTADFGSVSGTPTDSETPEPVDRTGDQPPPQSATLEEAPGGETSPESTTAGTQAEEETTPQTPSLVQPDTGGTTVEQYATQTGEGEVTPPLKGEPNAPGGADQTGAPRSPGMGTVGDPGAGPAAKEPYGSLFGEGVQGALPVDTEAAETALAAREVVPDELAWRASPAPGAFEEASTTGTSPATPALGGVRGDVAPATPVTQTVAQKRSPGATQTFTLFLGALLLLSGVLVHGATGERR